MFTDLTTGISKFKDCQMADYSASQGRQPAFTRFSHCIGIKPQYSRYCLNQTHEGNHALHLVTKQLLLFKAIHKVAATQYSRVETFIFFKWTFTLAPFQSSTGKIVTTTFYNPVRDKLAIRGRAVVSLWPNRSRTTCVFCPSRFCFPSRTEWPLQGY